jgi:hypothetical protein
LSSAYFFDKNLSGNLVPGTSRPEQEDEDYLWAYSARQTAWERLWGGRLALKTQILAN